MQCDNIETGQLVIMPTSTIDNQDAAAIQAARVGVAICDRTA
ncbi:hypothetical protein [Nostoc linckia]|nr:hypothetical protein [Nostoc linckia]